MARNIKSIVPAMSIHPGDILKDELGVRKISQTDFANSIGISITQLNELIKGKRNISADFALLLEKALKINADYWMRLQNAYELDTARIKEKTRNKLALVERWNTITQYVPVKYFKKQQILKNDIEKDEVIIKNIYNAKNIDDIIKEASKPCLQHFKKSTTLSENIINIVGWVKYVEYQSRNQNDLDSFSVKTKDELITELKKLSNKKNLITNTEKLLKKFGIKFIVQEKPDKAPIDGIAFWIDKNPSIGVTIRHHRIDNFIFTIMHELGHLYLHLSKDKNREFVDDLDNYKYMNENADEKEANKFATDNLIPQNLWNDFIHKHYNIDDEAVIEFASDLKIHPAIVKGRLCHEHNSYYKKRFGIPNEIN